MAGCTKPLDQVSISLYPVAFPVVLFKEQFKYNLIKFLKMSNTQKPEKRKNGKLRKTEEWKFNIKNQDPEKTFVMKWFIIKWFKDTYYNKKSNITWRN